VFAIDKDNSSELFFRTSDPTFSIDNKGQISSVDRLDADQNNNRFFIYKFNVTVSDGIFEDIATIHLRVDNVNDESPVFIPTSTYYASVSRDAQAYTPVLQVQAIDPDHDRVRFSFEGTDGEATQSTDLFYIDADIGLIRLSPTLNADDLIRATSPQQLTVFGIDDGSCCNDETRNIKHISRAVVHIVLKSVNQHAPQFVDCSSYSEKATLVEGVYEANSPIIIQVEN
jgi:hypothetical protein